jgi:hypothetical protein
MQCRACCEKKCMMNYGFHSCMLLVRVSPFTFKYKIPAWLQFLVTDELVYLNSVMSWDKTAWHLVFLLGLLFADSLFACNQLLREFFHCSPLVPRLLESYFLY